MNYFRGKDTIYIGLMIYKELIDAAVSRKDDLHRYFRILRKKKPKDLDIRFHSLHNEVFKKIDCLQCANCCKTTSPIFREIDIERIAKKLKMSVGEFQHLYLRIDEDGDWVLQSSPCTFLMEDNKCFIYDIRPQACREYPHTDRKRMVQILSLTEKNALMCPAVAEITKQLLQHKL